MADDVVLFQNVYTKEEVLGGLFFAAGLISKTVEGKHYFGTTELEKILAKILEIGKTYASHYSQRNRKRRRKNHRRGSKV